MAQMSKKEETISKIKKQPEKKLHFHMNEITLFVWRSIAWSRQQSWRRIYIYGAAHIRGTTYLFVFISLMSIARYSA